MKVIDIDKWSRKDAYYAFKDYDNPTFSICTRLDVTLLHNRCKIKGTSFFADFLYLITKAANEIEELKIRFLNRKVVKYEKISPSFIVDQGESAIKTCLVEYNQDYSVFYHDVRKGIDDIRNNLVESGFNHSNNNNLLYISCLPWIDFTSVSNPYCLRDMDSTSIPRITWGMFVREGDRYRMAFDISLHHALVDGRPVSCFFNKLQEYLNNPDIFGDGGDFE